VLLRSLKYCYIVFLSLLMHSTCALLFQNLNMGGGGFDADADAAGNDDGKFHNPGI
jgi:hypothetical protein